MNQGEQTMGSRGRLFTMRMTEEESAQLEAVAQGYGLTSAGLIRMLVQREAGGSSSAGDVIDPLREGDDTEACFYILRAIKDLSAEKPASTDAIASWLDGSHIRVGKAFARLLNELRLAGYVSKTRGGYVLTAKGDAGSMFRSETGDAETATGRSSKPVARRSAGKKKGSK